MARTLNEAPRSALGEGADRLEQMSRSLKEQQVAQTQGPRLASEPQSFVLSPEEVWARKYMNQGFGPRPELTPVGSIRPVPAEGSGFSAAISPAESRRVPPGVAGEPIGRALGRAGMGRRRSWLGRLFRGE